MDSPARLQLRLAPLLIALLFAAPIAGVARSVLVIAVAPGLVLAALFTLALAVIWSSLLEPVPARSSGGVACALVFVAALAYALVHLYNPFFSGFPALTGGDLGQHVTNFSEMMTTKPDVYVGMATLAGADYWLMRLFALEPLASMRLEFYVMVALFAAALAFGRAIPLEPGDPPPPDWRRAILTALIAWPVAALLLLPIFHYLQADGYLPQLSAIVPLLWGLHLFGRARPLGRMFALAASLLLLRYTYLLNLADFVAACGVAAFVEARTETRPLLRRLLQLGALCAIPLAGYCYLGLARVSLTPGGITQSKVGVVAAGLLVGSAALLVSALSSREPLPRRRGVLVGALGSSAALAMLAWMALRTERPYYLYKYAFVPALLVGSELVLMLGDLLLRGGSLRLRLGLATVGIAGLVLLCLGNAVLLDGYRERAGSQPREGTEPAWRYLTPLQDPPVAASIRATLATENARFGGLATRRWPESSFTNAALGRGYRENVFGGNFKLEENHCVFWYSPLSDLPQPPRDILSALVAVRSKTCATFHPTDTPARVASLCHSCLGSGFIHLGPEAASSGVYPQEDWGFWTNGHAVFHFRLPRARACLLKIRSREPGFMLALDGTPLAAAAPGLYALTPELLQANALREEHELKLDSASTKGSPEGRFLGTPVQEAAILCAEQTPAK